MNRQESEPNIIKQSFTVFYTELLKPITSNEEDFRKELVCNTILLFIAGLTFFLNLLVIYSLVSEGDTYDGIPFLLSMSITAGFAGLLCLSRIGYSKLSGWILIHLLVLGGFYAETKWGIDLPSVILLWCFVITAASILLSTRYAVLLSVGIGISSIILAILERDNIYIPIKSWKTETFLLDDAIEYSFIFILIAGISWLSNREIFHSFRKMKESRDELRIERDTLEIRVKERTEELQKVQAEKIHTMYRFVEFGRLSSGLFHDLMNPLQALCLSVYSLKDSPLESKTDNSPVQQQIDNALHASRRLEAFIQNVRKQIRIDIHNEYFSVSQEIQNVIRLLRAKASSKKVEILYTPKLDIQYFGSPTLFSHILVNIVSNAIDAYENLHEAEAYDSLNRKVSIRLKVYDSSSSDHLSGSFTVSVKDTGRGIPFPVQSQIFNPFFTTKDKEGCGIGLSATKHTLEKYFKGSISFTSNKEYGTIFTLNFSPRTDGKLPEQVALSTNAKD